MGNKIKIYLDTSVINFLFAEDAPEKREITIELFEQHIKTNVYDTYASPFVLAEIEETKNQGKRKKLLSVIEDYSINIIDVNNTQKELDELATLYIKAGIIPLRKIADAYHIATSVLYQMNYLVSWNYKHLANIKKEHQVQIVNMQMNFRTDLRIITPLELITYGE